MIPKYRDLNKRPFIHLSLRVPEGYVAISAAGMRDCFTSFAMTIFYIGIWDDHDYKAFAIVYIMLNLFQHLIEKQMVLLTTGNFGYRHTYQVLC